MTTGSMAKIIDWMVCLWQMTTLTARINVVLCILIVISLMLYDRGTARHRHGVSVLAYFAVLTFAGIPFLFVFGMYRDANIMSVISNSFICAVVLWYRGNMARIVDALRRPHDQRRNL